jgi:four helix bundle protein
MSEYHRSENDLSSAKYRTFEDLRVYQIAREFRKEMYRVNRRLPDFEKFDLGSQIRRAAVSLTNNIAEGHGRYHYLEQIKFSLNARGSLKELLDDLNVCSDESYLPDADVTVLKEQGWHVHKLLNGHMRWLRQQRKGSDLRIQEDSAAYGWSGEDIDLLDDCFAGPASTLQPFNGLTI